MAPLIMMAKSLMHLIDCTCIQVYTRYPKHINIITCIIITMAAVEFCSVSILNSSLL